MTRRIDSRQLKVVPASPLAEETNLHYRLLGSDLPKHTNSVYLRSVLRSGLPRHQLACGLLRRAERGWVDHGLSMIHDVLCPVFHGPEMQLALVLMEPLALYQAHVPLRMQLLFTMTWS